MDSDLIKIERFIQRLPANIQKHLLEISRTITFPKGSFLVKQGEICRNSYLIESGVARKFYQSDTKEITTALYFENDLAICFSSYARQEASTEFIQVLSDVRASAISYDEFQTAKKRHPVLLELDLMLTEFQTMWLEERLFQFQTLSATERYKLLLQKDARVIQAVPVTIVASYLGISIETLSRIRAKM